MASAVVTSIYIYPVKACQGISVQEAVLAPGGFLVHDRAWAIVDLTGARYPAKQSLSMRNCPLLASIAVALDPAVSLTLSAPGMPDLVVSLAPKARSSTPIKVECGGASTTSAGSWHLGLLDGDDEGPAAAAWLSAYLNAAEDKDKAQPKPPADYRLVRSQGVRHLSRFAGPTQAPFSANVALQRTGAASPFRMATVPVMANDGFVFHDVAPLHVASTASLDDLKSKMALLSPAPSEDELDAYTVRSFRPNVVVGPPPFKALAPWAEEDWSRFRIGAHSFRLLKGCPRCSVPARHWATGAFHFPKALLAPQLAMRKFWPLKCVDGEWEEEWQGPIFGVHVGFDADANGKRGKKRAAVLRVGDAITVHVFSAKKGTSYAALLCRLLWVLVAVAVAVVGVLVKLSLDDLSSGATPKGK